MSKFLNQKTCTEVKKNLLLAKEFSLFEETMKPVKDLKLPYGNEKETEADGNCLYNAIMDQIINNPRVAETISNEARKCTSSQEL